MDEFISREATIKRIKEVYCVGCNSYHGVRCRACGTGDAIDMIEDAPAADVVSVIHGRWVEYQIPPIICCSNCDWATGIEEKNFQHCPNCGAKMDGGADNG